MREGLARLLKTRGYVLRGESESGKSVKRFEKEKQISETLFNIIKSEQIFRVIGYFLFGKSIISTDELIRRIKESNLKYTLSGSIIKKSVCQNCKHEILFLSTDKEPNVRCQKCGRTINKIEDEWNLKDSEIFLRRSLFNYLNKLENNKILSKILDIYCPLCFSEPQYIKETELKNIKVLKCKCGGFKEVKWVYTTQEHIINLWEGNGAWLEWYIKNLLIINGLEAIQGVKLLDRKNKETEVDCLTVKSGKIISISCKAASFNNTYNTEPDISKLIPFSDYVIFVTTTKITDSIKSRYQKINPKCKKIFVDGNEIEKLPEIIDKIR